MDARAQTLIASLNLRPHPEGGYFGEVYRSPSRVRPGAGRSDRAALTTIYFLLTANDVSRWHQVDSDEVWHFYEGAALELLTADERFAPIECYQIGPVDDESRPVQVVAAGRWQAARSTGPYTLVGCTVAPGFEFEGFRLLAPGSAAAAAAQANPKSAPYV